MDTLEEDFRLWLAQDNTPNTGIAALVGINVYFTAVPTNVTGGFIATRVARKDAVRTTQLGGGNLCLAKIIVQCCYKGVDPVANYVDAKAIAQAIKARVNSANGGQNGTWVMGNTTLYDITIDDKIEGAEGDTEKDGDFGFQAGASSGIQCINVSVAFHYWNPNS